MRSPKSSDLESRNIKNQVLLDLWSPFNWGSQAWGLNRIKKTHSELIYVWVWPRVQVQRRVRNAPSWCRRWRWRSWGTWSSRRAWRWGGRWCWPSSAAPRLSLSGRPESLPPPPSPPAACPYCTSEPSMAESADIKKKGVSSAAILIKKLRRNETTVLQQCSSVTTFIHTHFSGFKDCTHRGIAQALCTFKQLLTKMIRLQVIMDKVW